MSAELTPAGLPWPETETYEHWHEVDRRTLDLTRLLVAKIDADPRLLQVAMENLEHWRDEHGGSRPQCLDLWEHIFANETWEQIRRRLLEQSDEGQRIRTSHPFAGILTQEERESVYPFDFEALRRGYEEATGMPWPASREMVIEQFGTAPGK